MMLNTIDSVAKQSHEGPKLPADYKNRETKGIVVKDHLVAVMSRLFSSKIPQAFTNNFINRNYRYTSTATHISYDSGKIPKFIDRRNNNWNESAGTEQYG